jgi:membrane protein YdbS with pleckstrin-like domain
MDDLTNQGIQALKGGEKDRARSLFLSALEIDADDARAWLWLSGAVESEQDRLDCLEQVIRIDPNNQAAAKGVALLVGKGIVPSELRGQPAEEATLPPQEKDQGGWQHEVPEETPAAPAASTPETAPESQNISAPSETPEKEEIPATPSETPAAPAASMPETVPESQNISAPSETPEKEEIPATPSETPAAIETTPWPAAGGEEQEADTYKLPESFFQPLEATEEPFPGWMASLTTKDATLPPAVPLGQAESAHPEAQASPVAAPIPAAAVQAPGETIPQMMETPAPAAAAGRLEEKTLFKIRPSLVTTVFVYGLGAIILFVVTMGLLLVITNADSVPVLIGLILVVCLLIAMLGLLIWESISRLMAGYTFTNWRLYMEQGVVRRSHKSIPLPKITSVTLQQGPLQKIIGIGNLTVHTEAPDGKEELTRMIDVPKAAQVINRIDGARRDES